MSKRSFGAVRAVHFSPAMREALLGWAGFTAAAATILAFVFSM